MKGDSDLKDIEKYRGTVRGILLDTFQKGKAGGTGKTFDWSLALKAKHSGLPLILAGGLNPDNIREAITTVRPYALDVNSGIEEQPGRKNPDLMKILFERIHAMKP
jgi:phosphoribosylanthranilate isomerase